MKDGQYWSDGEPDVVSSLQYNAAARVGDRTLSNSQASTTTKKAHKGQNVDGMVSDEYYEQEEDDLGGSLCHNLLNSRDGYSSKSRSTLTAAGRKSKASYVCEYEDDDVDFEDEDDDLYGNFRYV